MQRIRWSLIEGISFKNKTLNVAEESSDFVKENSQSFPAPPKSTVSGREGLCTITGEGFICTTASSDRAMVNRTSDVRIESLSGKSTSFTVSTITSRMNFRPLVIHSLPRYTEKQNAL
jgi:hypothetical protein